MVYTLEELVVNDSFIAYCMQQREEDILFWNDYLLRYPEELLTMEEARKIVLSLKYMLQKKQDELSASEYSTEHMLYVAPPATAATVIQHPETNRRKKSWMAVAAVVTLLIATGMVFLLTQQHKGPQPAARQAQQEAFHETILSNAGEHKTIELPDGTHVTMNAASSLSIEDGFGETNRNIHLTGEAFFSVAHNKTLPFIVHVAGYKVKALGTKFNVKAYTNDSYSETSLLEGKVQILLNKGKDTVIYKTLEVNQKFVLHTGETTQAHTSAEKSAVVPLAFADTRQNVETAWINDYLVFYDQPLAEIKNMLERKYNVSIHIVNDQVAQYRYSASFQKETVDAVLKALQLSYPFSYTRTGTIITIDR